MPTLGLGMRAPAANSATMRCRSGSSCSVTHFTRIVQLTMAGPTRYWMPRMTTAMMRYVQAVPAPSQVPTPTMTP